MEKFISMLVVCEEIVHSLVHLLSCVPPITLVGENIVQRLTVNHENGGQLCER